MMEFLLILIGFILYLSMFYFWMTDREGLAALAGVITLSYTGVTLYLYFVPGG